MGNTTTALIAYAIGLIRPFWKKALFATTMGGVSSLAAVSLLSFIEEDIHAAGQMPADRLTLFIGLLLLMLASQTIAGLGNSYVGQNVIAAARENLTKKILSAPIAEIERFQNHRIIAALNEDIGHVSEFTRGLSYLVIASCQAFGCFVYLAYLSWPMFLLALAVGVSASFVTRMALKSAYANLAEERSAVDELQKHYRALIDGAKELRVNRDRRSHFLEDKLLASIARIRDLSNRAFARFIVADSLESGSFFLVAGALIGLSSLFSASRTELAGFMLVLMYVKAPVTQIVASLPMFGLARASFERIVDLSDKFAAPEPGLLERKPPVAELGVEALELRGVHYAFPSAPGVEPFVLGPIDLVLRSGETLFVTGENGSGKTTLIKLILGLYQPTEGCIFLDGAPVTNIDLDDYRQLFSAIFFDFYLFDDLDAKDDPTTEIARRHLERLDIAHKVAIRSGRFSTIDLSAGQRKRLALVGAYLEKRPIMVFDEWAAEQDPTFRRIFYREILPELKQMGKTLIVVSHDDRYFDAADRVIQIDGGRLVKEPLWAPQPGTT